MRKLDRGREIAKPRRRRDMQAPKRGAGVRPLSGVWRVLRWLLPSRPLDAMAAAVAIAATSAVLVNALMLQPVPHPAPLFASPAKFPDAGPRQIAVVPQTPPAAPASTGSTPIPAPRPEAAVQPKPGLVLDIQRGLAERGYYDGVVDGLIGPRTQQAIRNFEQAQGIRLTGEPSEALLARILQARARGDVTGSVPAAPAPSARVFAVQRVLARLGYGPLKLSGLSDRDTRSAIERFERDRGLPRSGEIGERLIKELVTVTGAPVE